MGATNWLYEYYTKIGKENLQQLEELIAFSMDSKQKFRSAHCMA